MKPIITIVYCARCKWLLRAGWMAQELLSTFEEEIGEVKLRPDFTGGVYEVLVNDELVYSRAQAGGFPEIKDLKQMVRDKIAPDRDLGHIDGKN